VWDSRDLTANMSSVLRWGPLLIMASNRATLYTSTHYAEIETSLCVFMEKIVPSN